MDASLVVLNREGFQLHHTGIKTDYNGSIVLKVGKFQLHHTGIKTRRKRGRGGGSPRFQLHHTGIKTGSGESDKGEKSEISIAPYRN